MKKALLFIGIIIAATSMFCETKTKSSNWQIQTTKDSLTGEEFVIYYTTAVEAENITLYPLYVPYLAIRINKTKGITEVFIYFSDYLGTFDNLKVNYRFDQGSIITEYWNPSTKGTAIFSPNPYDFIKEIRKSKELVFRVYDYSNDYKTVKFKIDGLPSF